jgi:chromosome segregation ATPase
MEEELKRLIAKLNDQQQNEHYLRSQIHLVSEQYKRYEFDVKKLKCRASETRSFLNELKRSNSTLNEKINSLECNIKREKLCRSNMQITLDSIGLKISSIKTEIANETNDQKTYLSNTEEKLKSNLEVLKRIESALQKK